MDHYIHRLKDPDTVYALARDLFIAGAVTCVLSALHRMAAALTLTARVKAFDELEDEYTPEELKVLVSKIKMKSLHC